MIDELGQAKTIQRENKVEATLTLAKFLTAGRMIRTKKKHIESWFRWLSRYKLICTD